MKIGRPLFYILLLVISSSTIAQQNHFIYIQSEDKQPFYILLNGKNYNSSPNGYLTVPGLSETAYMFTIGFVKNKYPEQKFAINVQDDKGFFLKQAEDKSWSLIDLQDQTITLANQLLQMPDTIATNTPIVADTAKSRAPAVDTTMLNNKAITNSISSNTIMPDTSKNVPLVAIDTTVQMITGTDSLAVASATSQVIKASIVLKMLDKQGKEGIDLVYTDQFNGKTDTIAIFIPVMFNENRATPSDSIAMHCTLASEEDFRKLRAQMAAADDETGMIQAASAAFKEKCFSAEQIKNLSVLFLEEQHRLDFFVASKPYVYDAKNFINLQSQLSSPALIQQFKNLVQ